MSKKIKESNHSLLLGEKRRGLKHEEEQQRKKHEEEQQRKKHGPLYIIENGDDGKSIQLRIKKKQSETGRHFVVTSGTDSSIYQRMDPSHLSMLPDTLLEKQREKQLEEELALSGATTTTKSLIKEVNGGYKKRRKTRKKRKTKKRKKKRRRKTRKKVGHNLLGGGI